MSRFVPPPETGEQEFAAFLEPFLERLTGSSRDETAEQDSGVYFTSSEHGAKNAEKNSVANSVATSRTMTRPLAPESKARKRAAESEGAQISYEKALRLHTRHRNVSEDDLPKAEPDGNDPQNHLGVDSANIAPAGHAKSGRPTGPDLEIANASRKTKQAKSLNRTGLSKSKQKGKSSAPSIVGPKTSRAKGHRLSNQEAPGPYLQKLRPQALQLPQRRAVVSVRLTEVEFAQLRDRADESGISVSAYMRSCVLDAEILRAQVKQALAEMRAFRDRSEPARNPAIAPSRNADAADCGAWFRVLQRSAAFLLSPLLPFRRSA
ncbi:plasmid mobilization protein [Acidicapsa acidisoli]|uniref:plasmid mobilization protein n=1 Tax=Acidicapsa acidisoli TaxID=1615681 RepID=UPI0021DFC35B|nr:hypothetical protein [Acidicapsa acidisoli]